jgi:hypothetical protein
VKTEMFGTIHKPNARWQCGTRGCGQNNVTRLMVPVRRVEIVHCKRCHRPTTLTFTPQATEPAEGAPTS